MGAATSEISRPRLLIGEGKEEEILFKHLLETLEISSDFQVETYNGKENLGAYLSGLKTRSGFSSLEFLFITRDADIKPDSAFQSVQDFLKKHGFVSPEAPATVVAGSPNVGVFVLPGERRAGMLEDVCLDSVKDDPAMKCVERFFECIQESLELPSNLSKARTHAFLSSRKEPDLRLGEAALKGYWKLEDPAFDGLKAFLRTTRATA